MRIESENTGTHYFREVSRVGLVRKQRCFSLFSRLWKNQIDEKLPTLIEAAPTRPRWLLAGL